MDIRELMKKPASWLSADGDENEIVLSSRVRLARNLEGHRFTHVAQSEELSAMLDRIREAAMATPQLSSGNYLAMGAVSTLNRQFLAERHLVSREFLFSSSNRGLVVNGDEDVCLMINEEDHLRLQAYSAGLGLARAFERVDALDTALAPQLEYAYSDRLGFLTACPTNIGTGLRASVLVHLPGLVHSKEINKLLESLRQLHHSIRGLYGEGSEVLGNFFQLSNSSTLGTSEEALVGGLREMVVKVIGFERKARDMLFRKARSLLEDKVWRAYGLLKHARSVSTKEALSLISAVRLGIGVGIVEDMSLRSLNELLVYIQPAHLQMHAGKSLDTAERDVARAEFIRETLSRSRPQQEE